MEDQGVYEVRYGPTVKNLSMFVGSVVLMLGCFLPELSMWIRVPGGVLFGAAALLSLLFIVSRRVAFRVDGKGITMAAGPLRYHAGLLSIPWTEIESVVLWKQPNAANMPYVGVQRRAGSSELQRPGPGSKRILRAVVPHIPAEIVTSSRAINGWRLDRDRLTSAVALFAPDVNVVDLG
jgi:hypothetical protein